MLRGEPVVCTPQDAYRCFMRTETDYLVIEDFILTTSRIVTLMLGALIVFSQGSAVAPFIYTLF